MEVKLRQKDGTLMDLVAEIKDGVIIVEPKKEVYYPKEWDIVFSGHNLISIYKCLYDAGMKCYASLSDKELYAKEGVWTIRNLRPATEEERQKLFKALADKGLSWNAEKRELVEIKWKPMNKKKYYHPSHVLVRYTFDADTSFWKNDKIDKLLYEKGWAFPYTEQGKADCQKLVDKLNEAINSVKL